MGVVPGWPASHLRAVAVVHVPVDDEHPRQPMPPYGLPGCDGHRVQEAEAGHPVLARVVAGWSDQGYARAEPAGDHARGERDHAARGEAGRPRRVLVVIHVVAIPQPAGGARGAGRARGSAAGPCSSHLWRSLG
eukprot:scaffold10670_cov142-Isochrysis_galbana.AAC.5